MVAYETSDGPVPALPLPSGCPRVLGAWWKPSAAFVDDLVDALAGRSVLEVFSGNGYLASLLSARGVRITATTLFSSHDYHEAGLYHPVIEMEASEAVKKYGDDHDILLFCWPTVTDAAVLAAATWGTTKPIAYIGDTTDYVQGNLGCCATDLFFEHVRVQQRLESYVGSLWERAFIGQFSFDRVPLPGKKNSRSGGHE